MLILSRRKDERIVINDDLYIRVTDIKRGSVKLCITGDPEKYKVDREEVYLSKKHPK